MEKSCNSSKHGYWVNGSFCSVCGKFPVPADLGIDATKLIDDFDFCPHCGADLVGATVDTCPVNGRDLFKK